MTREEHLKFCSICKNRAFDPKTGIVCGLTMEKADFSGSCENYTEDEKEKESAQRKVNEENETKSSYVRNARITLFIIGGLHILAGFLEAFIIADHHIVFGIIDWTLSAVFIGLGFWSYRNPKKALITGLIIYLTLHFLLVLVEPTTLLNGIIWKILITYYLYNGFLNARKEEKNLKMVHKDLLDDF